MDDKQKRRDEWSLKCGVALLCAVEATLGVVFADSMGAPTWGFVATCVIPFAYNGYILFVVRHKKRPRL